MKTVGAAKFKQQCLSLLDHIAATSVVHQVPLLTRDRSILRWRLAPLA